MHEHKKIGQDAVLQARMVKEANLVTQAKSLPHDQFVKRLEERLATV